MDKATSVLAALDAGKLPSQKQVTQIIDWFQHSVLTQVQPGGQLTSQGKIIADGISQILEAYKKMGASKNSDNLLQQAIWHLAQGDISDTSLDVPDLNVDEATADIRKLRSALRTLLGVLWTNVSSEGTSLLQDFASVVRLALADAAEVVEAQAREAKQGLREVESGVQDGERDSLGRLKKSEDEQKRDSDPKVKWEKGMDTVKGAGSTVIEAGQTAKHKAEDVGEKTSNRVTAAYYQICERAQRDPQYHAAISTFFDTVQKWLTKSLDTVAEAKPPTNSPHPFIHDPNPEQHIPKALESLQKLAERFAGGRSLGSLFEKARTCAVDVRSDSDLGEWFEDFFAYVRKSLDEPGYARSDRARETYYDLRKRWEALRDQDSEIGKKWKKDVVAFKAELKALDKAMENDVDLKRVKMAHRKLGRQIEDGLAGAGKTGMQMAMDHASWFWQDLFKVYAPRVLGLLRDIPIPRTEYKDHDVEFVLEDVDISSFNLLPSHIYIRNITDIDINTPASPNEESRTAIGTLTHIRIQAMQLTLKEVSFFYRDKLATLGPKEFTGVMEFKLPEKGIDVDLKLRLIPSPAPEGSKSRERHGGFHQIERVEVRIAEEVELDIKQCNHQIMLSLFKPIVGMRLRNTLEKALQEQIRGSLEWVDAVAWDISKRAEVFSDAGLATGSSYIAAIWSEIGRLERMKGGGFLTGWKATGTGVMKEEKGGDAQFAMGVEPQIISGSKHGPKANFAKSLAERLPSDAEGLGTGPDAGVIRQVAGELVHEGKEAVKSFQKTVEVKTAREKKRPGWESVAFNVNAGS